jgi:hypothetical protein
MSPAEKISAQAGNFPWENAVNVLQTASPDPIATGLALVATVVGGLLSPTVKVGPNALWKEAANRRQGLEVADLLWACSQPTSNGTVQPAAPGGLIQ